MELDGMGGGYMVRCCSMPSTTMALTGRTGQRFSQAPQPMQRSASTTGPYFGCSPPSKGTMLMAPAGQWRAQLPQCLPSFIRQFSRMTLAVPIFVLLFSARSRSRMASVGHTSEQRLHSGRQYPCSYPISGCMKWFNSVDGLNTPFGHCAMHSSHAVQCWWRCCALSAPGGSRRFLRVGTTLSSMTARPPSTFFSACAIAAPAATVAVVSRKARRVVAISSVCGFIVFSTGVRP